MSNKSPALESMKAILLKPSPDQKITVFYRKEQADWYKENIKPFEGTYPIVGYPKINRETDGFFAYTGPHCIAGKAALRELVSIQEDTE